MTYFEDVSRKIVECLKVKYGDKLLSVILFGSTVQGRRRLESDLDVIVVLTDVMEGDRSVRRNLESIMVEWGIPIDPLVFTVEEFKYMLDQRHPLILGVLLGYKTIYDRLGVDGLLSKLEDSLYKEGWRRYKWSGLWIKP
ncbi:nucleotidyltransferase domain-containing protein [Candidatus Bathyarchaeota archaeon]|nr:nucleotidyltransferase domain-containing protein [Candidatus Bathyarchaeota archaeon]MBS7613221.1 nucleotidyltransferase domain-containing protein [Candidatus Bathyarchaeota archaeon]MBS7617257.1 nucleotidyltransferase domain-containing protein [Candidatus Bathyarchaeota archaeon]